MSADRPEAQADHTPADAGAADPQLQKAIDALGKAINTLDGSEKRRLAELKAQTEKAARYAGPEFDKRLEFCYAIVFAPELASNQRLQAAAQRYIDAVKPEDH